MRRGPTFGGALAAVTLLLPVPAFAPDQSAPVADAVLEEMARQQTSTYWVVLSEQADLGGASDIIRWAERGRSVHDALTRVAERSQSGLLAYLGARGLRHHSFWIVNAIQVTSGPADLDQIRRRKEVKEIRADIVHSIPAPEPGAQLPQVGGVEWNVARINAPQVWSSFGVHGEGVVVASIDTGVQFDHPALARQYRGNKGAAGYDHSYNWFDPTQMCPYAAPCDIGDFYGGHGTHTMGTMVGDDGDGNQIGVAPGAQWIAVKGCETNFMCSSSALAAAAQWILAPTDLNGANPRPDLRPHVVNNSWGGGPGDPFYEDFVRAWVAAGIFPAFANGNSGPGCGTAASPADYPESYASGAFDANDAIWGSSSRGPSSFGVGLKPNITAPGVNVRSSVPGAAYKVLSGTSMASPHTTATVALLWAASPSLFGDIDATRRVLDQSALDRADLQCGGDSAANNVWGEGALDALAAVQAAPRGPAGVLQGTVTDAATGFPLDGATVEVTGPIARLVKTDAAGFYHFPVLPPGSYSVTLAAFGYADQAAAASVIDDGTTIRDFPLAPAPRFRLDGTVRDAEGSPIPNALVTLENTPMPPAVTDSTGVYSFAAAPQGSYDVRASEPRCFTPQMRQVTVSGNVTGLDFTPAQRADSFGYTCRQTTAAYVEAGTILGIDDTNTRAWVSLPFPFPYYGRTYDAALVCAFGTTSFGAYGSFSDHCAWNYCPGARLASAQSPDGSIDPFWAGITLAAGSVRTQLLGSAPDRRFVIEWRNVSIRGPDVTVDFEVILHENGLIETQYRNIGALEEEKGICATIGIEDPSGSIAFSYSYDRPLITAPEHAALYRPPASSQSPYPGQPFTVPGFIQAEDFDRGGEGVAYHDNVPGNAGALYRPNEDVDIIAPYAGGYVVNNFETGEWMEYSIQVAQSGIYSLQALVSSELNGSRWHMEIDGADVTGPMDVPNTGYWGTFRWMESGGVSLTAGRHVLRIAADQPYFNLDALGIVDAQSAVTAAGDVSETLSVGRAADGSITLSWGGSCAAGDDDYEVYSGTIGAFAGYVSRLCTTGGLTTASLPALSQDEYYLVVPRNPRREGSYGLRSDGAQRPQGSAACLPRAIVTPCP